MKNTREPLNNGMIVEVNCPNCGMISFIGSVRDGETKELHCEAGEASCGWTWEEKFKMENVHNYDIESFKSKTGKWNKTNWGHDDKEEALDTARDAIRVFGDKDNRQKQGHLANVTDGVRVVDREGNILFEWIRNENNTES